MRRRDADATGPNPPIRHHTGWPQRPGMRSPHLENRLAQAPMSLRAPLQTTAGKGIQPTLSPEVHVTDQPTTGADAGAEAVAAALGRLGNHLAE
jgi:hypothetical protein